MMTRCPQSSSRPAALLILVWAWPFSVAMIGTANSQAEPACGFDARESYLPWVFLGYGCAGHCREHKAGFAWAERNGIGNPTACTGGEGGFTEGCRAYAEYAVTAEQAGFEWAVENDLTNRCDCSGAGDAFRAGCEAYLRETGEPRHPPP
jgi:hypothetical protein